MQLFIYNLFLRVVNLVFFWKQRKKTIIFESLPDYSGSPKMICLEMEKRGYRSKYIFVWAVDKSQTFGFRDYECVPFWGNLNFFERMKKNLIVWNAVLIVDSNRAVAKTNKKNIRLFTNHGGTLKNCAKIMRACGRMDYCLSLSSGIADVDYKLFKGFWVDRRSQILELGYPANDELFESVDLDCFWKKMIPNGSVTQYEKIIGWFPTFRQRAESAGDDSELIFPYGIPVVYNKNDLDVLNELLKRLKVLLVIQIHHAQKKIYDIVNTSNILVVDQKIKDQCGINNANLMHSFDALITDYSAAYHEFIMLNRPIAVSIDDYDDYNKNVGFSIDFFEYIKGFYVRNLNDLKKFVKEVSEGKDSFREKRTEALFKIHKYIDADSTQRVCDFICNEVRL